MTTKGASTKGTKSASSKAAKRPDYILFDEKSGCIVYGLQTRAVQRMLDFDYACKREQPSVAAIVNPTRGGLHKCFWGTNEVMIPIYKTIGEALEVHSDVDAMVNFASFRSSYPTTIEALNTKQIRVIGVIAEGIPERKARHMAKVAHDKGKWIIGPATVGGLVPGAFKIGNTAGTLDNILMSKLNRKGSVGFVSKSGGMSNEMYNIIARNSDGVFEGHAIGGDKYPGSTLLEHLERYERNPDIKMNVCLGEVGGKDEYEIVEAINSKKIKKPLVMWVTGTCAKVFPTSVQFGHAGAKAGSEEETADAKNTALKKAGVIVPNSFDDLGEKIGQTYDKLVKKGVIKKKAEPEIPDIPEDYDALKKMGKVRKPTQMICSVSSDIGPQHSYLGVPIQSIIEDDYSIGDIISMLWFAEKMPKYATDFIELVIKITADHGPCVSGAHNAIVASRAGKDVMSCLASGILTIGPRFGGAIEDAGRCFRDAQNRGLTPEQFVKEMKVKGKNIQGIGHRIKSVQNPDKRVDLLKDYAKEHFPRTDLLDYALGVE
ncbi:MAG: ATP citrate synthase, partial [Thermoplasmata archaeon]|nr:ATP citrate synthase [Thermoplasmata archaeon]